MIKHTLLFLILSAFVLSCDATGQEVDPQQTPEDLAAEKCLFRTQWGFDKSQPNPYAFDHWFRPPEMYFNTSDSGYFSIGIKPNYFDNNTISNLVEVHFTYQVIQGKLIFDIHNVSRYSGILRFLDEKNGEEAKSFAFDFMNLQSGQGIPFTCLESKFRFLSTDPSANIPLDVFYWSRRN